MLVQARQPINLGMTLLISGAVGVLVVVAGCVEFSRREIQ
jgi:hypothetical protein